VKNPTSKSPLPASLVKAPAMSCSAAVTPNDPKLSHADGRAAPLTR
jgi:hypothetical protein